MHYSRIPAKGQLLHCFLDFGNYDCSVESGVLSDLSYRLFESSLYDLCARLNVAFLLVSICLYSIDSSDERNSAACDDEIVTSHIALTAI